MPKHTIVCKLQDQDITDRIGRIVTETAPDDYIWIFGSLEKAATGIQALAHLNNNHFSKRFITTCVEVEDGTDDKQLATQSATTTTTTTTSSVPEVNKDEKPSRTVLGVMVGYQQSEEVDSFWDYKAAFGWWYGLLVFLKIMFVTLTAEWPHQRRRRYDHFYIQDIAVHPEARGRGVGSKIINFTKMRYLHHPELGVRSLTLDVAHYNTSARRLYERLGFAPQHSLKDRVQLALHHRLYWTCMELPLFEDTAEDDDDSGTPSTAPAARPSTATPRHPVAQRILQRISTGTTKMQR